MDVCFTNDDVIIDKGILNSRFISEIYSNGHNLVPKYFLNDNNDYGKLLNEFEIKITKDRFFEINEKIRNIIKYDIEGKKRIINVTESLLESFHNSVIDFEESLRNGSFDYKKMNKFLDEHIKVTTLTEYNGCLPIDWYKKTLYELMGNDVDFYTFGITDFMSHRQQFRNAKLRIVKEYIQNGNISEKSMHEFFVNYYHLDPKLDQIVRYDDYEVQKLNEEIITLSKRYTVESIDAEINLNIVSFQKAYYKLQKMYDLIRMTMTEKKFSEKDIENYLLALRIISVATTEEEYRHMQQDKFFRLMTYVCHIYKMSPVYSSMNMIIDTVRSVPYSVVCDDILLKRFV